MVKVTKKKMFRIFIFLGAIFLLTLFGATRKNLQANNSCGTSSLTEEIDEKSKIAIFEGREVSVPQIALNDESTAVLGQTSSDKWIEVDLSEQKLRAWDGNELFLETLVSTGLPWWPTPRGEFKIWSKVRATKMEGGTGKYYYNLPNVPYVMFFENNEIAGSRGFSLHGTYWHNDFGNVHSHGCVNLPTPIAEKLYSWVAPFNGEQKGFTRATDDNPGTRVVIHE